MVTSSHAISRHVTVNRPTQQKREKQVGAPRLQRLVMRLDYFRFRVEAPKGSQGVNTKLGSLASLISFIVSRSHRGMTPSLKDHALLDSAARFSGCGLCVALLLGRRLAVPAMQAKLCLNQVSNYPVAHQSTSIVIQFTSFHLMVFAVCWIVPSTTS